MACAAASLESCMQTQYDAQEIRTKHPAVARALDGHDTCSICLELLSATAGLDVFVKLESKGCEHAHCTPCIASVLVGPINMLCPQCNSPIQRIHRIKNQGNDLFTHHVVNVSPQAKEQAQVQNKYRFSLPSLPRIRVTFLPRLPMPMPTPMPMPMPTPTPMPMPMPMSMPMPTPMPTPTPPSSSSFSPLQMPPLPFVSQRNSVLKEVQALEKKCKALTRQENIANERKRKAELLLHKSRQTKRAYRDRIEMLNLELSK